MKCLHLLLLVTVCGCHTADIQEKPVLDDEYYRKRAEILWTLPEEKAAKPLMKLIAKQMVMEDHYITYVHPDLHEDYRERCKAIRDRGVKKIEEIVYRYRHFQTDSKTFYEEMKDHLGRFFVEYIETAVPDAGNLSTSVIKRDISEISRHLGEIQKLTQQP